MDAALHRLGEGRGSGLAESMLEPAGRGTNPVEIGGTRHAGKRADRLQQLADRLLRGCDTRRVLGEAECHELRAELVEVAAGRGLLGELAERRDRDGRSHGRALLHRLPGIVEREPARLAPGLSEGAEIEARSLPGLRRDDSGHLLSRPSELGGDGCDPTKIVGERHAASIDSHAVTEAASESTRVARELFAPLGETYDRYASLLSFGQDPRWRTFLVSRIDATPDDTVLDVATGTAAVAIELARTYGCSVVGIDQSAEMLAVARQQVTLAGQAARIRLLEGRAENLPFDEQSFDALTFTYLLRYVHDPEATLRELVRVVRPGGRIASLEFGVPPNPLVRAAWESYVRGGLPLLGRAISPGWHRVGAFLGGSIREFYARHPLESLLGAWRAAGVEDVKARSLTFGGGIVFWGHSS